MTSAIYLLDNKGTSIISRNYRSDLPADIVTRFSRKVLEEDSEVPPIVHDAGYTFVHMPHQNVHFVAVTRINTSPAMMLQYLHKLIEVLTGYLGTVTEESVRDNFVVIYELFDEMMDFGYPQFTELKVLKEYVTQESHKLMDIFERNKDEVVKEIPSCVTGAGGATPWRQPGIKHRKNELFVDVIEKVNFMVSAAGEILHAEIYGTVQMKCHLSGMPELKLGLNEKLQLTGGSMNADSSNSSSSSLNVMSSDTFKKSSRSLDLEDCKFHPCIKMARFDSDNAITFIPPDGEFELMCYRLTCTVRPLILIEASYKIVGQTRVEFTVKAKAQYKQNSSATGVEIRIPVPQDVDMPQSKATTGSVQYCTEDSTILWSIKIFPGTREHTCEGNFTIPTLRAVGSDEWKNRPVCAKFEILFYTVSGIQVRYVKVHERSGYNAMPWVRYLTRSGEYQFRASIR